MGPLAERNVVKRKGPARTKRVRMPCPILHKAVGSQSPTENSGGSQQAPLSADTKEMGTGPFQATTLTYPNG